MTEVAFCHSPVPVKLVLVLVYELAFFTGAFIRGEESDFQFTAKRVTWVYQVYSKWEANVWMPDWSSGTPRFQSTDMPTVLL